MKKIAFADTETHGLYGEVAMFQWCFESGKAKYKEYPSKQWMDDFIKTHHTVWYGASYDLGTIGMDHIDYKFDDLQYASRTAYPALDRYSLDVMHDKLGLSFYNPDLDKKKMQKSFVTAVARKARKATPDQIQYGLADVLTLRELWKQKKIRKVIKKNRAYKVDIESLKYSLVYQRNGIPVDRVALAKERAKLVDVIAENKRKLGTLNPNSPKQVCEALKIPSSGKDTMVRLINGDDKEKAELAQLVYDQRRLLKADGMLKSWDYDRVHTFFNPAGAVTGRFTSSGGDVGNGYVNTQQISRQYQYMFHSPGKKRVTFEVDYSTAELRAGCSIMNDRAMHDMLMAGKDLHIESARMTGIENPTREDRQKGKAVSFGLIFSMSAPSFQEYAFTNYGVKFTLKEAQAIHRRYHNTFTGVSAYHQGCWSDYKFKVYETAFGRKNRARLGTDASNYATQGSIAEATKWAVIVLVRKYGMKALKAIVNVVHDAIYLDVKAKQFEEWEERLHWAMLEGWREVCKSDLFHFKDIPMPMETEIVS